MDAHLIPHNTRMQSLDGGGVGVNPNCFFIGLHGAYFSPSEPLNTTQQIGAAL